MEASRFGFGAGAPAAYKFDPADADIVAHYLLPRALNLANPNAHAIIDDDPASAPPWELLRRNGHGGSDHAFFFAPPTDAAVNGGRRSRAVDGGTWQGQTGVEETLTLVREPGGGAEVDIKYKRYHLTFYTGKGSRTTGFVMHEYQIISPPLPGTMLARIRVTDKGKEYMATLPPQQAEPDAAGDQQFVLPMPEQPSEADAAAADQMVVPLLEQPGPSYQYHDAATVDGEGQTYVLYGGSGSGMAATAGYYAPPLYVPEGGGGEYNNYCQYQDQLYPSYQNHAVNAAVMCAGEGFSIGQTGNGGGMEETTGGYVDSASIPYSALDGGADDSQYNNEFLVHGEVKQELDYGE